MASSAVVASRLIGRDAETERLDAALDRVRERGGSFVIRGEPGIGKSALLEHVRERASSLGARALTTTGVESEAELAFAGLHQLLRPITRRMDLLSDVQRDALEGAFGLRTTLESDAYRVALAAYDLVCEAAGGGPLVLILDDAQWLDRSSLAVLTFIARRLESESAVLVAAVRNGDATALDDAGLPTLQLECLGDAAAAELLDREAPDLSPHTRAYVLAEAAGNPLGLLELARAASKSGDANETVGPAPVTLTARLERAFASRLDELSAETRVALLAGALDSEASLEEILGAAARVSRGAVTPAALDEGVALGFVDVEGARLSFRHPLIRSAVQQTAPRAHVLAMYAALAEVVADPERSLWQRAMASLGADEQIARELDDYSDVARGRGAVAVAVAALERAAGLSQDVEKKGERMVRAAELAYELGLVEMVHRLLRQAEPLEIGPLETARFGWLEQMISGDVWSETGAGKTFVAIADRMLEGGDAGAAIRSLAPIAHRCWWAPVETRTREYLIDAAQRTGVPAGDPRLLVVAVPQAIHALTQRLAQVDELVRDRADRAGALDLASQDVLIEVMRTLEKQLWMIRSEQ
jgi:AAA ATPase domain